MNFEQLWPWIQLGIVIAQRHLETSNTPITLEEAKAAAEAEYNANKQDIAAWFISKGLEPPQ